MAVCAGRMEAGAGTATAYTVNTGVGAGKVEVAAARTQPGTVGTGAGVVEHERGGS